MAMNGKTEKRKVLRRPQARRTTAPLTRDCKTPIMKGGQFRPHFVANSYRHHRTTKIIKNTILLRQSYGENI